MKARWTFLVLSVCVLLALGLAAWLTSQLFTMDIDDSAQAKVVKPPRPDNTSTAVMETVVDIVEAVPVEPATEPTATKKNTVTTSPAADFVAETTLVVGKVFTDGDPNKKETPLTVGMRLDIGRQVRTEAESRAELKLGDGSSLAISEKSLFIIDEFIFVPNESKKCSFSMRVLEGLCRIVTGAITSANPDRFKVKTRMATIGIRGCELAFKTKPDQDNIYILGLGGRENVTIEYDKKGDAINDTATGKTIATDPAQRGTTTISEPGTVITLTRGLGMKARKLEPQEFRKLTSDIFFRQAVQHKAIIGPSGTTFEVVPKPENKTEPRQESK